MNTGQPNCYPKLSAMNTNVNFFSFKWVQLGLTIMVLGLLFSHTTSWALRIDYQLANDVNIRTHSVDSNGRDVIIWLPSERGQFDNQRVIADNIGRLGISVVIPDLFAANLVEPSLQQLDLINSWQIAELIKQVAKRTSRTVWLFGDEGGAILALRGMRFWQQANPQSHVLGGAILLNPRLNYGTPQIGASPDYLPIASATNKPVAMLLSEYSALRWHHRELVERLSRHGMDPLLIQISKVRDWFYRRLNSNRLRRTSPI